MMTQMTFSEMNQPVKYTEPIFFSFPLLYQTHLLGGISAPVVPHLPPLCQNPQRTTEIQALESESQFKRSSPIGTVGEMVGAIIGIRANIMIIINYQLSINNIKRNHNNISVIITRITRTRLMIMVIIM